MRFIATYNVLAAADDELKDELKRRGWTDCVLCTDDYYWTLPNSTVTSDRFNTIAAAQASWDQAVRATESVLGISTSSIRCGLCPAVSGC